MARQVIIAQTPEVTAQELKSTTSILPVKTTNYIMQDAVPSGSATNNFGVINYYFDDVVHPINSDYALETLNCEVTYIDNGVEKNKKFIAELSNSQYGYIDEVDNFGFIFTAFYLNNENEKVEKANVMVIIDFENYICAEVKKVTMYYESYSNLLKDEYIESLDFNKLTNVEIDFENDIINKPGILNLTVEPTTLNKEYLLFNVSDFVKLFNNKFEAESSKINDLVNENDTYTPNSINNYGHIEVNSRSTETGSGQFIVDTEDYNSYYIIAKGYNVKLEYCDKKYSTYDSWKSMELNDSSAFQMITTSAIGGGLYVRFKRINDNEVGRVDDLYVLDVDKIISKKYIDKKVDKVKGKQLSTNDFTNELKTKLEGLENSIPRINPTTTAELYDMVCSKDGLYYIEGEFSDVIDDTSEYVYIHGLISTENVEGDGLLYIICFENLIQVNIRIENKVIARVDYMHVLTQFLLQSQLWGGKKGQVLTKLSNSEKGYYTWADIPQLSFDADGNLVVTIDGVSKTFVPKEETVQASYNSETETISLNAE